MLKWLWNTTADGLEIHCLIEKLRSTKAGGATVSGLGNLEDSTGGDRRKLMKDLGVRRPKSETCPSL